MCQARGLYRLAAPDLAGSGLHGTCTTEKHHEIAEHQRQIAEQLQKSHEADSEFKMAVSGLLSLVSRAADLFESANNAEKRSLIGFTFRTLSWKAQPSDNP